MATLKPILMNRGRAALLATACLVAPLSAGEPAVGNDLIGNELSRRSESVEEAQMLLQKGDQAYQAGRYSDAVEAYSGARDMIPEAPVSAELRQAATERYVQASVEHARQLSRKGDVAGAKTAVDKVLSDGVAPNDPGALAFRAQLDDPIRTNPALSAEHAKHVDQVRRLLYTAEGAFNLGKFDEAITHYEEVLRIDPTNTAARRGMEQTASAKSSYGNAAHDQARAEMLSQVDAAWETQLSAPELGAGPEEPGATTGDFSDVTVAAKLDRIIIPKISLDQASLDEAVDFLRLAKDDKGMGVNFEVNLGPPDSQTAKSIRSRKFNLRLTNVPMARVLKYIAEMTETSFTTDEFSVIITPVGSSSGELISRTYRVPPDFITSLGSGASSDETKAADPFAAAAPAKEGLLTKRLTAQEALAKQGVAFPEGASASYSPATNTLRVINTATNQDFVAQVVETLSQAQPVTVSVRVTMIKTQETNLKELSFDWLVNPITLAPETFLGGGTPGNTPGRTGADFSNTGIIPYDPTGTITSGVVTNGLRSGTNAVSPDSIDELINNPNRSSQKGSVAPGILSVTGLFSDGQAQTLMRGLDQKKGVDIMAKPAIMTRSGQASTIEMVREFIYPTEYEPPQLPNSVGAGGGNSFPVTPATPTAFQKKQVGITLEVLPVADANKRYVDITLNPTISDFDGFVNYGSPINSIAQGPLGAQQVEITANQILMPVFSSEKANTQLTVADGSTIVIGGLMSDSIKSIEDKVPVLGEIPFIGRLFQSSVRQPISTAIIFLVHVELLDPTGRPYRQH